MAKPAKTFKEWKDKKCDELYNEAEDARVSMFDIWSLLWLVLEFLWAIRFGPDKEEAGDTN